MGESHHDVPTAHGTFESAWAEWYPYQGDYDWQKEVSIHEWCRENLGQNGLSFRRGYLRVFRNRRYALTQAWGIRFKNEDDALLFKLAMSG